MKCEYREASPYSYSILKLVLLLIFLFLNTSLQASSFFSREDSLSKRPFHKTALFKNTWVPLTFTAAGIWIMNDRGPYSSHDIRRDMQLQFPGFHTSADEYLRFAPIAFVYGADLIGLKPKTNFWDRSVLLLKSEVLMAAIVYPIKYITKVERPSGEDRHSFPSGHTAQAFLSATFMHKEFGHKSIWYSIGAYSAATATGVLAVMNDRHWASDVLVGAGVGILSVNIAYWTHRYKWGGAGKFCMMPYYGGKSGGVVLSIAY